MRTGPNLILRFEFSPQGGTHGRHPTNQPHPGVNITGANHDIHSSGATRGLNVLLVDEMPDPVSQTGFAAFVDHGKPSSQFPEYQRSGTWG